MDNSVPFIKNSNMMLSCLQMREWELGASFASFFFFNLCSLGVMHLIQVRTWCKINHGCSDIKPGFMFFPGFLYSTLISS